MKSRDILFNLFILSLLFIGISVQPVRAANPFSFATGFFKGGDKVEADPKKEYKVTEINGPWMICVMSYSGDNAENQAKELVFELRKRYKLHAYIHEMTFDHTKDVNLGNLPGAPTQRRIATGNLSREWAVLIGDFQSFSDNDINETLKKLKSNAISPECLKGTNASDSKSVGEKVKNYRKEARQELKNNLAPLACSFKTPNPVLPKEYFAEQKKYMDDFVVSINSRTPYSILNCRGKYTIMVAKFTGKMYIRPSEIEEIESGKRDITKESKLIVAAENAEKLCESLRKQGFEAYTFHDRTASIVTVGAFNHLGDQLPNGCINYMDEIAHIIKTLGGQPSPKTHLAANETSYAVKSIDGIPLIAQPIPIETPRQRPRQTAMR